MLATFIVVTKVPDRNKLRKELSILLLVQQISVSHGGERMVKPSGPPIQKYYMAQAVHIAMDQEESEAETRD